MDLQPVVRSGISDELARHTDLVLLAVAAGGNEAIAEQLSISLGTVKNHVSNLYSKLGVRSRAEAVAWAWGHRKVKE